MRLCPYTFAELSGAGNRPRGQAFQPVIHKIIHNLWITT